MSIGEFGISPLSVMYTNKDCVQISLYFARYRHYSSACHISLEREKTWTDDGRPRTERYLHGNSCPIKNAEEIWVSIQNRCYVGVVLERWLRAEASCLRSLDSVCRSRSGNVPALRTLLLSSLGLVTVEAPSPTVQPVRFILQGHLSVILHYYIILCQHLRKFASHTSILDTSRSPCQPFAGSPQRCRLQNMLHCYYFISRIGF